ncbi:MAG: arabinogalactan endo-1,4-beta-galactosidase, partial [Firmicutes bacterium]|nr:arabinogalactan endo-1,4-beta-galactosidase [Bacillota bacterium]
MKDKRVKIMAAVMAAALALGSFAGCGSPKIKKVSGSESLFVRKVDNMTDGFILGMDVSSVLAEEASGVKYFGYDIAEQNTPEQDIFLTLAQSGINY